MILVLTTDHAARVLEAARVAYPAEACGLLVGHWQGERAVVARMIPAPNLIAHVRGRFELDPAVRLKAEKECRASGERVLGHWHSHPDGPAEPSATDWSMAYEPELVWLIAGVPAQGEGGMAAFRVDVAAGRFAPIGLTIEPAEGP